MALYNGFSTVNRSKHFRITDFELVKQDLINHFNIRKGEKLMNPDYGTSIWNLVYEPMDENTKNLVMQDVRRVISSDPRVVAENVIVTEYDRGLQIQIDLIYVNTDQRSLLSLQFDQGASTVNQLV